MKKFLCTIKDKQNKIIQKYVRALNYEAAAAKLYKQGYVVLRIEEDISNYQPKRLRFMTNITEDTVFSLGEKNSFFSSFYSLYKSGSSIVEILKSMMESAMNEKIKAYCYQIIVQVERGSSLKDSMSQYYKVIGLAYTMLLVAGEKSGKLEEILQSIKKLITKEQKLFQMLILKLIYPIAIIILAISVFLLFQWSIIPAFSGIINGNMSSFDVLVSLLTVLCLIILIWICVLGVAVLVFLNKLLLNKIASSFKKLLPIRRLVFLYEMIIFFEVLSLSYSAGIPLANGIKYANSVVSISFVNSKVKKIEEMVSQGCEITTAFNIAGIFSKYAISQVSAGEKSGELDIMFRNVSVKYEKDFDTAMTVALSLVSFAALITAAILTAAILLNGYNAYYSFLGSL